MFNKNILLQIKIKKKFIIKLNKFLNLIFAIPCHVKKQNS